MQRTKRKIKSKNRRNLVIGITGGAGSGKSTIVEKIIASCNCKYIHCDEIAHELMEYNGENYNALLKEYGEGILLEDKRTISRPLLAKAVEQSEKGYKRLNAITHPNVIKRTNEIIKNSDEEIILIEAALLIEAGMGKICDEVWYIYAPLCDRVRRLRETRGYSDDKISSVLKNQLSHDEFLANTDYVINNGDGYDKGGEDAVNRINTLLDVMEKNK